MYRKVEVQMWGDESGIVRRVPPRLYFGQRSHAALRAFVFRRDGFTCRRCGIAAGAPPDYRGDYAPWTRGRGPLHLDHVVARAKGGSNHPSNLQTLCEQCNCRKGATTDKAA